MDASTFAVPSPASRRLLQQAYSRPPASTRFCCPTPSAPQDQARTTIALLSPRARWNSLFQKREWWKVHVKACLGCLRGVSTLDSQSSDWVIGTSRLLEGTSKDSGTTWCAFSRLRRTWADITTIYALFPAKDRISSEHWTGVTSSPSGRHGRRRHNVEAASSSSETYLLPARHR